MRHAVTLNQRAIGPRRTNPIGLGEQSEGARIRPQVGRRRRARVPAA